MSFSLEQTKQPRDTQEIRFVVLPAGRDGRGSADANKPAKIKSSSKDQQKRHQSGFDTLPSTKRIINHQNQRKMEKLLSRIGAWAQMLIAAWLVAVAGFNFLRAIHQETTTAGIIVLFTALLGAAIALLIFSVRDYEKLLKDDKELENIKPKKD